MTASRKDVVMNAISNRQTRSRRYDYSSDSADIFHARGSLLSHGLILLPAAETPMIIVSGSC